MLCQNEHGVLSGSDYFLPTASDTARELYYYTPICGHYHCEPGYLIERDTAQCFLLITLEQGELGININGQHYVAQAGDTVLLDCYRPHRYYARCYMEFSWFHVAGANSQALCSAITGNSNVLITQQQYEEIKSLLHQLLSRLRNNQRVTEPMCARAIYSALCCLMSNAGLFASAEETNTPTGKATAYIQEHLGEPLSLKDLSAYVGLSPYHFARIFKKSSGYSPYEYVILLRIDQAKYLLKNTPLSIKEIGIKVGYSTEISFINAFTQKVGISPGRFRRLPLG